MMLPAGSYLAILIVSLLGLYLLDRTHKLAFTVDAKRSLLSMVPAYVVVLDLGHRRYRNRSIFPR
jgi:hypothetical protein